MRPSRIFLLAVTIASSLGLSATTEADVPARLSYQGILTQASGMVVANNPYQLRFRVFDNSQASGTPLFVQQLTVAVEDGIYNVILSDNNGYSLATAFSSGPRYMEVAIVVSPTNIVALTPLQEIASVPFALTSARAVAMAAPPPDPLPPGAIILWQETNTCPPGFEERPEFRNLTVRGADRAALRPGIPDGAGISCDGEGAIGAGCGDGTNVTAYNDKLEISELAKHRHKLIDNASSSGSQTDKFDAGGGSSGNGVTVDTNDVGNDAAHYHPFRTVLFCKRLPAP